MTGPTDAGAHAPRLQALVAQCWTSQQLLLIALLVLSLVTAAIRDDFTLFLYDPGATGWRALCVLLPLFCLMAVLARVGEARWLRWTHAALLGATLLLPLGHQVRHFREGRAPDLSMLVEVVMVIVAVIGARAGAQWARSPTLPR
jgi:hypothetical protein